MHRTQCEAATPRACMSARSRLLLGASFTLWLAATPVLAQQAEGNAASTAAAPAGQNPVVADVVVTGERPAVRTSIDRTTYNVSRDLQGATGSVSDVLRNLPSVNVDVRGNVSLRGDSSVQILVDGKPSSLFSAGNRAQALQQLSASTVESIEVMTNPSAEFAPDGTGGIINIVMKKATKPGRSGSVQAGAGSLGRANLNLIGARKDGPLSLNGNLGVRRTTGRGRTESDIVRIDAGAGQQTAIAERSRHEYATRSANGSLGIDYDVSVRDRLSLSASLMANEDTPSRVLTQVRGDPSGVVTSRFDRLERLPYENMTTQLNAGWRRTFAEPGRVLSISARRSRSQEESALRTTYDYPAGPQRIEERRRDSVTINQSLAVGYTLPLANEATLKAGYDFRYDRSDDDVLGLLISSGAATMPNVTNHFVYRQDNHQLYTTYQRPFGKFIALAGLRLEQASIDYAQLTTDIRGASDHFDVHPSLHLQYALKDDQTLTFSYSHRVQRPSGGQLNPFVVVQDDFNASAGNPDLTPQEAHSLEGKWQWQGDKHGIGAALYLRETYNTIGRVSRFLTPLVLLDTYENRGRSTAGGMELDASGKLHPAVSYRLNANLSYQELQTSTEDGAQPRSAYAYTARAGLDWRPTAADFFQVTGNYAGRQLTPDGFRRPWGALHLGYQRKLRPDLVAVLTVSDLFDSAHDTEVIRTRAQSGLTRDFGTGRTIAIGVTRQLGGRPVRERQFEYEEIE